jgi:hypothetical protein
MPIQEIRSTDAWASIKDRPEAHWSSGWENEPAPGTAWNRIKQQPFRPRIAADFPITKDDEIFAIGSCFARGVEGALRARGFTVASTTSDFDRFPIRAAGSNPFGFTNKYNPWSIANELEWAFERGNCPEEALVQMVDGERWTDPHACPIFEAVGRDETVERHRILTELFRRAQRCRVITVTLGLIEAWYDHALGIYTNSNPPGNVEWDRFTLRVLSFAEVEDALERIHALLARHCLPGHQVVVTVSPVPLDATFTGNDVVIANTHSKALLRAAAAEWCARHENLHYFPSYEIVTSSDRNSSWYQDGRHVHNDLIGHIMDVFVHTYVANETAPTPVATTVS